MNSLGVFREGQIDGKPFHIFSFSFQPSSSSSSSSGVADFSGDHPSLKSPQSLVACPSLRCDWGFSHKDFIPYNDPPHYSITKINDDDDGDDDDNGDDDDDFDDEYDTYSTHTVLLENLPNYVEFKCGACERSEMGTTYYICLQCREKFHKECVESPLQIQHPSFPFLPFQLSYSLGKSSCISCKLDIHSMCYHCPTNNLSMHTICAMKPIPIHIDHPKRHPHTLIFFPKQTSLVCDVCGLVQNSFPTYICPCCIFVVHQDCIYLPFVIKISRHPHHRISFTSSLPSGNWSCGVCRKKIDNHCGAYSCNKCGDYFVHSKCAVRKDVWDGIELEGVPEEPEEVIEPFEMIADGVILHFTHGHHLKLEASKVYNEYTFCQACILPVYQGNYYSCFDGCDFVLHETCASTPRKIHHALHAHPLMLKATPRLRRFKDFFACHACDRYSCGFVYEERNSYDGAYIYEERTYRIDVRCASVSEPFRYEGHQHPLFMSLDPTQEREATCRICQEKDFRLRLRKLSCIETECNYVICFRCATLPYEAKYKHDSHFLTFREGKEGSDVFDWCDKCERKIEYSSLDGYYECDKCCTTLHVHCLLGETPYLQKPGQVIQRFGGEFYILLNNTQSRPLCCKCHRLCPQRVVFKRNNKTYCSRRCLYDD